MKTVITTVVFAVLATGLYAQDLVYTHDANGNRIVRETLVLKTANPNGSNAANGQQVINQDNSVETYLLGSHIVLYPNPTKGLVTVQTDSAFPTGTTLYVYDSQGRLLRQQDATGLQTAADLSNQPAGVYIMRLTLNGRSKEWRVVKE
jgi:hypothetical protein